MSNTIRIHLEQEGFRHTTDKRILAKPEFRSIEYSDGHDVENNLLQTLKKTKDVSVLSEELMEACEDWVTTYHFSHTRSNLLRPFKEALRGNVLELGAGLGAITRFLAETAKEVVAVEGSYKRCEINSERLRGMTNTTLIASEISAFKTSFKFDAVVVVGVLEYAALFLDSKEPHSEFLRIAADLLKPEGVLLLAIENQLGLKYFAGAPEDHLGKPMIGIESQYKENGVRTFSRDNLRSNFVNAGFHSVHTHAPLPDYKIVRGIISHQGLETKGFPSGELASQLSMFDPQLPRDLSFDLARSWVAVGDAGLDSVLANSFLVEARFGERAESALRGKLAFWYGSDRKPKFLKEKTFLQGLDPATVWVSEAHLMARDNSIQTQGTFRQDLLGPSEMRKGITFAHVFSNYLTDPNWSIEGFANQVKSFIEKCSSWALKNQRKWPNDFDLKGSVDRSLVDLLPRNVVTDGQSFEPFDLEWVSLVECEMHYLVFRICLDTLASTKVCMPERGNYAGLTLMEALKSTLLILGLTETQIEKALLLEVDLQAMVSQKQITQEMMIQWLSRKLISTTTREELQSANHELQSANHELLSSNSWRFTKPLRWAVNEFRKLNQVLGFSRHKNINSSKVIGF